MNKAKRANEVLAANIRRLMENHPTLNTQAALSRRSKVAQSSIARIIGAAVHPQLDVIEAIAGAFGLTVSDLLSEGRHASGSSYDQEKFAALPAEERGKAESYIRFLIAEYEKKSGESRSEKQLIRIADLHDLSEEQLAQVMRAALRELNHNTLANDESAPKETKRRIPRSSGRH